MWTGPGCGRPGTNRGQQQGESPGTLSMALGTSHSPSPLNSSPPTRLASQVGLMLSALDGAHFTAGAGTLSVGPWANRLSHGRDLGPPEPLSSYGNRSQPGRPHSRVSPNQNPEPYPRAPPPNGLQRRSPQNQQLEEGAEHSLVFCSLSPNVLISFSAEVPAALPSPPSPAGGLGGLRDPVP